MHRVCICALVLAGAAGTARADDPGPVSAQVELDHGRAHLVATWRWKAERGVQTWRFALPEGALVTTARFQAGGVTRELVVADRTQVDKLLVAAQHRPVHLPQRGAVELTTDGDDVAVDALLPATGEVMLVVELDAPTCFAGDARYLRVPETWPGATAPTAPSACRPDNTWRHGFTAHWLAIPTGEAQAERIVPRAQALVAGDRELAEVELVRGAELAQVPADLATVIVVDHSRSLTPDARAGESALLAAYAGEVPASRLAVVAFARTPSMIAGWGDAATVAPAAIAALERSPLANGSNVLRGIATAGELLAHTSGTRRVIVLSDDRFSRTLGADRLAAARSLVPAGTVIHTVTVTRPGTTLVRDDRSTTAPLAAATEGEPFAFLTGAHAIDTRPLLRPELLENVELELANPAAGWTQLAGAKLDHLDLAGGEASTWWFAGSATPHVPVLVTMRGQLWGRRWHAVLPLVRSDRDVARAALAALDDTRLRAVAAELAAVLDDHHALYAAWGGTGGYRIDVDEVGVEGGTICDGLSGNLVEIAPPPPPPPPPPPFQILDGTAAFETGLRAAIDHCSLAGAGGNLDVELTGEDEIVGVTALVWGGHGDRAAAVRCIEEAVWALPVHVPGVVPHSSVTLRL